MDTITFAFFLGLLAGSSLGIFGVSAFYLWSARDAIVD